MASFPDKTLATTSKHVFENVWRGLWRAVNFLQSLPGFHVDIEGLDTLLLPSLGDVDFDQSKNDAAWLETRVLCDDAFHPLIDALIAADVRGPDTIGEDLMVSGRVVGAMEFGWSDIRFGVAEEHYEGINWSLVTYEPEASHLGDTVISVLKAIEEKSK